MKRFILSAACALMAVCLLTAAGLAETRQATIMREGEEETILETRFDSSFGISLWYPAEHFGVTEGWAVDGAEGVCVYLLDGKADPEDAEYTATAYVGLYPIASPALATFREESGYDEDEVQNEYTDEDETTIYEYHTEVDDSLVRYTYGVIACGTDGCNVFAFWPEEMDEGFGRMLDRVIHTVTVNLNQQVSIDWAEQSSPDDEEAAVTIRFSEAVTDFELLKITWDDMSSDGSTQAHTETVFAIPSLNAGQTLWTRLTFVGEMPNNGIAYTDQKGQRHQLALLISGNDGGLYFWSLEDPEAD